MPTVTDERTKLLIISYSQLYRDARLLRQIRLFSTDYAVTTCGYGPAPEGVVEHHRIPDEIVYWRTDRRLVVARLYQRAYERAPITTYLRGVLAPGEFDVILANDVLSVPLAVSLAPRGGVHADLHEYATRQQEEVWRWRRFIAPYYASLVRRWVRRAESATTVGSKLAQQYHEEFGVRCGVVLNAPHRADLPVGEVTDPIRLVHAGGATPARLETILAAMDLVTSGATLDLYLVSTGSGYVDQVKQRYADHPRVRVHDGVPTDRLVATLNDYDVGIHILPPVSFNHLYAMPNKIFDYVQARLGVLVGPSPEMASLVREHDLGWVSEDFTAASVARTIDALTPQEVRAAKTASDLAAQVLCAETQVAGWAEPVARLAQRARLSA